MYTRLQHIFTIKMCVYCSNNVVLCCVFGGIGGIIISPVAGVPDPIISNQPKVQTQVAQVDQDDDKPATNADTKAAVNDDVNANAAVVAGNANANEVVAVNANVAVVVAANDEVDVNAANEVVAAKAAVVAAVNANAAVVAGNAVNDDVNANVAVVAANDEVDVNAANDVVAAKAAVVVAVNDDEEAASKAAEEAAAKAVEEAAVKAADEAAVKAAEEVVQLAAQKQQMQNIQNMAHMQKKKQINGGAMNALMEQLITHMSVPAESDRRVRELIRLGIIKSKRGSS